MRETLFSAQTSKNKCIYYKCLLTHFILLSAILVGMLKHTTFIYKLIYYDFTDSGYAKKQWHTSLHFCPMPLGVCCSAGPTVTCSKQHSRPRWTTAKVTDCRHGQVFILALLSYRVYRYNSLGGLQMYFPTNPRILSHFRCSVFL